MSNIPDHKMRKEMQCLDKSSKNCHHSLKAPLLAAFVQKLDGTIHRINHFPVDKYWGHQLRQPVDRDLSGG